MKRSEKKKLLLNFLTYLENKRIYTTKWPTMRAETCYILQEQTDIEEIDTFLDEERK